MMMISRPRSIPPDPAQQLAVAADHGDDLRAVGTNHDGAGFAADLLGLDIARAVTEAILLVVTNERLAAGIDNDDPAGFGEDLAAALIAFLPRATEIFHAARPGAAAPGEIGVMAWAGGGAAGIGAVTVGGGCRTIGAAPGGKAV